MKAIKIICLPVMFLLPVFTGCEKDKLIRTPEEQQILQLAYSKDYSYPAGFYHEIYDSGSPYYENTLSIMPLNKRQAISIELNTNNKDEARQWSDSSNAFSSVNREVIGENETFKYFEFTRKNVQYSSDIIYSRVHKSSYFQPAINRFSVNDTLIGIYNGDMNLAKAKDLIEYLWSCGTVNVNYTKVSEASIKESDDHFEYYIQSLLIIYGDFGIRDEIKVSDNFLTLNKSTRELIVKTKVGKTIQGTQR